MIEAMIEAMIVKKVAIYKIRMLIQKCFQLIVRNWRKEKNTISQGGTVTYADSNKFIPIHFYAIWKVCSRRIFIFMVI